MHPQPDAKFSRKMRSRDSIRTCMGEDVNLDVELAGSGPFTLYWSFDKQMYSESVDGNKLTINVPRLETPGQHTVSLVKVCTFGMHMRVKALRENEERSF